MEKCVHLCKSCLENDEYIIPMININQSNIIYMCQKHNELLNENDVVEISMTEKIKERLKICKSHEEPFSAWCTICKNNLCHKCIARQQPHKHDYSLFAIYLNNFLGNREIIKNKISEIIYLINICGKNQKIKKGTISLMILVIDLLKIFFNFFYIQNIICYQVLKNFEYLIKYIDEFKNSYKNILFKDEYTNIISTIKFNQNFNTIKQSIFPLTYNEINMKIIPLLSKLYDDESKTDTGFYNNENAFLVYYFEENIIEIYTMSLKKLYKINLENAPINNNDRKIFEIIQYKTNILLLYYSSKIIFLILYPNSNAYDFSEEFNLNIGKIQNFFYEDYPKKKGEKPPRTQIIKINSNCVLFFKNYNLFYTYFSNNIYYQINKDINAFLLKKDATDVIPIYYYNDENKKNKGVKQLIALSVVNEGVEYDTNNNSNELNKAALNKIGIEFFIYDNNFDMKDFFKIYLKVERFFCGLIYDIYTIYSHSTNHIYIFIGNNIFQLNLKFKEITSIYELRLPLPATKLHSCYFELDGFGITKFYYFRDDSIKELILLNYYNLNVVQIFELKEKELIFIKEFTFSNFSDFVGLNIFEMDEKFQALEGNNEKIIINYKSLRIIK